MLWVPHQTLNTTEWTSSSVRPRQLEIKYWIALSDRRPDGLSLRFEASGWSMSVHSEISVAEHLLTTQSYEAGMAAHKPCANHTHYWCTQNRALLEHNRIEWLILEPHNQPNPPVSQSWLAGTAYGSVRATMTALMPRAWTEMWNVYFFRFSTDSEWSDRVPWGTARWIWHKMCGITFTVSLLYHSYNQ